MTDSMVERVAKAMWDKTVPKNPWDGALDDDYYDGPGRNSVRVMARAAIEAMRMPTPKMVASALPLTGMHCDPRTVRLAEEALFFLEGPTMPTKSHQDGMDTAQTLIGDWYTMIDAALSEAQPTGEKPAQGTPA